MLGNKKSQVSTYLWVALIVFIILLGLYFLSQKVSIFNSALGLE